MGKFIATCGHEVKGGGFHLETNGYTRDCNECSEYKSWCAVCVSEILLLEDNGYEYEIRNTELGKLRNIIQDSLSLQSESKE